MNNFNFLPFSDTLTTLRPHCHIAIAEYGKILQMCVVKIAEME